MSSSRRLLLQTLMYPHPVAYKDHVLMTGLGESTPTKSQLISSSCPAHCSHRQNAGFRLKVLCLLNPRISSPPEVFFFSPIITYKEAPKL